MRPRLDRPTNAVEVGQAPGAFAVSGSTGHGDAARTVITRSSQYGFLQGPAVFLSLSYEEHTHEMWKCGSSAQTSFHVVDELDAGKGANMYHSGRNYVAVSSYKPKQLRLLYEL